VERILVDS
jgi:hypothetical protein